MSNGQLKSKTYLDGQAQSHADNCLQEAVKAGVADPDEFAAYMGNLKVESVNFTHLQESYHYTKAANLLRAIDGHRNGIQNIEDAQRVINENNLYNADPAHLPRDKPIITQMYGPGWSVQKLGNFTEQDASDYRARGFIQLTGRKNYTDMTHYINSHDGLNKDHNGKALNLDLIKDPDRAAEPEIAAKISAAFWMENAHGDYLKGGLDKTIKSVNGGHHGAEARKEGAHEWGVRFALGYQPGKPDPLAPLNHDTPQEHVSEVQKELKGLNYDVPLTGTFDHETKETIKQFQHDHGLTADGIMGPQTRLKLYDVAPESVKADKTQESMQALFKSVETEQKVTESAGQTLAQHSAAPEQKGAAEHSVSDIRQTVGTVQKADAPAHGVKIEPISATPKEMHKTTLKDAPYEHEAAAPLLKEGSHGDYVLAAQLKLRKLDYTGPHSADLVLDGKFGHATEHAVREFQKANGLSHDGIIGAHTGQALDQAYRKLPQQVVTPENTKEATQSVTAENKAAQAPEPEKKRPTFEEMTQERIRSGLAKLAEEARQRQELGLTETQSQTQGRGMRMR